MESSKSCKSDELFKDDLFWEICSRMPAKAAIKVSSLSKSLYGLLSNPLFVEKQSIRSSLYDEGFFLCHEHRSKKLEFHVLPSKDGPCSSSVGIPGRSLSFLEQFGGVLCSSQGLVLVNSVAETHLCGPGRILICNPATGSCFLLPEWHLKSKPLITEHLVLECHPTNLETDSGQSVYFPSDYTIIAPLLWEEEEDGVADHHYYPKVTDFAVYRNGKWEEDTHHLDLEGYVLHTQMPVALFRGSDRGLVLHYLCDSEANTEGGDDPIYQEPYIVAYDLERKTVSRMFQLPKEAWDNNTGGLFLRMFKWRLLDGGETTIGLAKINGAEFRVWMLEDYDRGLWRRAVWKGAAEIMWPDFGAVLSCCVVNGTRLLLATKRLVYAYEMDMSVDGRPDASRIKFVAEHGFGRAYGMRFTPYANTLRPVCGPEGSVFNLGDCYLLS